MSETVGYHVTELSPAESYADLKATEDAVMIDVRTQAEWAFVGVPDLEADRRALLLSEWKRYPDMSQNPEFVDSILNSLGGKHPSKLFFLCRSGARSMQAAHAMAAALSAAGGSGVCINVAEGFEGILILPAIGEAQADGKPRAFPGDKANGSNDLPTNPRHEQVEIIKR